MLRYVRVHGVNEADVVDALAHARENVADPLAALAIPLESERRREEPVLGVPKGLPVHDGGTLPLVLPDLRLVVEGVHLGGPARHEELDHVLGPGSEMGRPGRQRRTRCRERRSRIPGPQNTLVSQDARQTQDAESRTQPVQHVAAVQRRWLQGVEHGFELLNALRLLFHDLAHIGRGRIDSQ